MFKKNDLELIFDGYWKIIKRGAKKTDDKGIEIEPFTILCHYSNFAKALERFLELTADKKAETYLKELKELLEQARGLQVEVVRPSYDIQECLRGNEVSRPKVKAILEILGEEEEA